MEIYIYKAEGFDKGNFTFVDKFYGADNAECEEWAANNYGDTDLYRWSYTSV